MKKILILLTAICAIACTGGKTTIYDFSAETNNGEQLNFSQYKGKVLLIDRKGRVVARFEPVVAPEKIAPEIEALL